ncbi:MAG: dTDP-4-dehydrorhamnose 3,5-epimerase family protein [Ignavibacteriae bacterium]|nr:dTDP-4-dehydrorhamnose 3,5-epimerase family protein [Ignavibacteriota bacterium]
MHFTIGPIDGVVVKDLNRYTDARGWLVELFRKDEITSEYVPAMSYISETLPGVARGPHEHVDQADLFCFLGPSTFRVYLWDARKGSKTYGCKMTLDAGETSPRSVIIPPGVVHAYKNIGSRGGWVINLPNRLYAGEGRKDPVDEIRHESDANTLYTLD